MKILLSACIAVGLAGQLSFAQGVDTHAKPTDWEEINFEFNQAVVVDGFPGMLRLADLLKQHPDYKVNLVGNADQVGGNPANDRLSLRRANAVAQFLQHYGANANQLQVRGDGKRNVEVNNRNANARFMNRRVVITVTAPDGSAIGDGSLTAAVNDFEQYTRAQLGKIDSILSQLHDLETQVRALQGDTGAIKQDTAQLKQDTGAIHGDTQELVRRPPPLTAEQTTQIARTEAHAAADYALLESAIRNRKYGLVGYDIGPSMGGGRNGVFTTDIFGSGLIPFGNGKAPDQPGTHALQVDGDWLYFRKRPSRPDGLTDGMFDIGLVNRFGPLQMGTFAQFDYVSVNAYQGGGLLGNGILTLDYVYHRGSIGVFGSKGFREEANVGTTYLGTAARTAAYLRSEDQAGIHMATTAGQHFYVEGSVAYKKRYIRSNDKVPAAMLKIGFPLNDQLSVFLEGDNNTTIQNYSSSYRLVFGIQFGKWLHPNHYSDDQGVVPVSVPRAHYELLNR